MVAYLAAAVIAVPIAHRLGLGSILGYLLAGVLVGPSVLSWVGHFSSEVMNVSEFGVIMMLFLVGLELEPKKLWRMRGTIPFQLYRLFLTRKRRHICEPKTATQTSTRFRLFH